MSPDHRPGAYGFQILGVEDGALLPAVPSEWPAIFIQQSNVMTDAEVHIGSNTAVTRLIGGGDLVMDRLSQTATIHRDVALNSDALVHPYLAPIAAVFAMWNEWLPFHAGGFVHGDATWLVMGGREAGKSSMMAALAKRGLPIVADDLVVVRPGSVCAGPRTLDLRGDVAPRMGEARLLTDAGNRERWRVGLDPIETDLPAVGGVFSLTWGDDIALTTRPAAQRLEALVSSLTVARAINMNLLMALGVKPFAEVVRPKTWAATGETIDTMLEATAR